MKTKTDYRKQQYCRKVSDLLGKLGGNAGKIDWDCVYHCYYSGKTVEFTADTILSLQKSEPEDYKP